MDRKNEKALRTLGDEELSAVAGAGGEEYGYGDLMSKFPKIDINVSPKIATVTQSNVAANFVFGNGTLTNTQGNLATVTQ